MMPWNLPRLLFFYRPLASPSPSPSYSSSSSSSSFLALLFSAKSARRSSAGLTSMYNPHRHHHCHQLRPLPLDESIAPCVFPSIRTRSSCRPFWSEGETIGRPPSLRATVPRMTCRSAQEEICVRSAALNHAKLKMQSLSLSSSSFSLSSSSLPPPSSSSSSSSCAPSSASSTNAGKEDTGFPMMHHSSSFLQISLSEEGEEEEKDVVNDSFALVVLNHDLPLLTPFLWDKARCRICADGGANQIYDYIPHLVPSEDPFIVRQRYKPDVIKGDLDSIRSEVKDFYAMLGTEIIDNSDDQNTTDLSKCLSYAKDSMVDIDEGKMKLLVLGALGGRLDHEFANLNSLYLFRKLRVILLSDESMTFLLPKGHKHEIKINPSLEGPYCGLLPLSGSSLCTTTSGLKWDLDRTSMEFGGLISTSNMPVSDHVMVSSDTDLVWTISLQHLLVRLQGHINAIKKGSEGL